MLKKEKISKKLIKPVIIFISFLIIVFAQPTPATAAKSGTMVLKPTFFQPGKTYNVTATFTNTSTNEDPTYHFTDILVEIPNTWAINSPSNGSYYTSPSKCDWNDKPWYVQIGDDCFGGYCWHAGYRAISWSIGMGGPGPGRGIPQPNECPAGCNKESFTFNITIPSDAPEGETPIYLNAGEAGDMLGWQKIIVTITELPQTGFDNLIYSLGLIGLLGPISAFFILRKILKRKVN